MSFVHNIQVENLTENFTGSVKHLIKIMVVFDCIRNFSDFLQGEAQNAPPSPREIFDRDVMNRLQSSKFCCNYEFTREYVQDLPVSDWYVTKLLHFDDEDFKSLYFR